MVGNELLRAIEVGHLKEGRVDEAVRLLDKVIEGAEQLRDELRWVHSTQYGRNPSASSDRVRVSGRSDPTGDFVVAQTAVRRHYGRAIGHLKGSVRLFGAALRDLDKAVEAADKHADEDALTGDGVYPAITLPSDDRPLISTAEREEREQLRDDRAKRGLGFGEA